MFAYDKTFDPEVVLGHCDLISRFSDFALYLDTQLVYFHTCFAPNFEKVGRAYCFRLVCLSVCLSVCVLTFVW